MSERGKRDRSRHPQLRERAIKKVDILLAEELYAPNKREKRPFETSFIEDDGHKYRYIDPQWKIDHIYVDAEGFMTQHPYSVSMEKLKDVIAWCDEHGYSFYIDSQSAYFPAHTIRIRFYSKREAPE